MEFHDKPRELRLNKKLELLKPRIETNRPIKQNNQITTKLIKGSLKRSMLYILTYKSLITNDNNRRLMRMLNFLSPRKR